MARKSTPTPQIIKEDKAAEDIETLTRLTEVNLETFANENNVWRSRQLQLEALEVADPMDRWPLDKRTVDCNGGIVAVDPIPDLVGRDSSANL